MPDIETLLKEAIKNKQSILLTFGEKPSGAYKVLFGIIIFGKSFLISRKVL